MKGDIKFLIKDQKDFFKLYDLIKKRISGVKIDLLLQFDFLSPMDILILTEFVIYELGHFCEVTIDAENKEVMDYLEAIGLLDFCKKNFGKSDAIEAIPSYTAMPLKRVTKETMHYYINATQQYFEAICPGKDLTMLNVSIAELINNVYDHAHSPIDAYVFSQFYPKSREILIAVSDLGIGIPYSVNSYLEDKGHPVLSKEEAVKWALQLNQTTQSMPHNAGKGLDNIYSFIKSNKSSWKLYTEEIMMEATADGAFYKPNPISNFIGTVIELKIIIDNLDEKDVPLEDDWAW